ncbi:MAG TPA: hypothetical protein DDZ81_20005 [Acetobacteraceae bacterium]|jgi:hypothetical protein|nr:hypothetical protein [Acetobacteraceae bacterium]
MTSIHLSWPWLGSTMLMDANSACHASSVSASGAEFSGISAGQPGGIFGARGRGWFGGGENL